MMLAEFDKNVILFGKIVKICAEMARHWKIFVIFLFLDAMV